MLARTIRERGGERVGRVGEEEAKDAVIMRVRPRALSLPIRHGPPRGSQLHAFIIHRLRHHKERHRLRRHAGHLRAEHVRLQRQHRAIVERRQSLSIQ